MEQDQKNEADGSRLSAGASLSTSTSASEGGAEKRRERWIAVVETALIFLLIVLYGAYPTPDVNEQYYVGKAIHCWNADYFPNDKFLDAPDAHFLFFRVFGVFSLILPPTALVWFGRVVIWLLTAIGWRRLSATLLPRPGFALLTAAGLLFYLENAHLAGEWIAGGVEGKGFAFPLVFLGLADFLRGRFNRAFLLLGGASAFHVLVGGWTVVAALLALLFCGRGQLTEYGRFGRRILPGLLAGGGIALVGLIPAIQLDAGTPSEILREAHRIYVFERLPHHLVPSSLPWTFLTRFGLLTLLWALFCRPRSFADDNNNAVNDSAAENSAAEDNGALAWRRWNRFVASAVLIAFIGLAIDFGTLWGVRFGGLADRGLASELLRFYWLRLSDWAVPAGVALGGTAALWGIFAQRRANHAALRETLFCAALWFFVGGALFFVAKKLFWQISVEAARAASVGSFPALPKPVDAVAFLAAALLLGIFAFGGTFGGKFGLKPCGCNSRMTLLLAVVLGAPLFGILSELALKSGPLIPRSAPPKESIADGWFDVCRWLKAETPEDAVILVPRGCDALKWNAERQDAGNWKEIPQDARSIVAWYRKMEALYTPLGDKSPKRWNQPLIGVLINKGPNRIEKQARRYGYGYIVAELPPYTIESCPEALKRYQEFVERYEVYRNAQFTVFRFDKPSE